MQSAEELDYYRILGLLPHASENDIRTSFRRLALRLHPRRKSDFQVAHKFAKICEAFDVLSQKHWKAIYDQYGFEGLRKGITVRVGNQSLSGRYSFHGECDRVLKDFFGVNSRLDENSMISELELPKEEPVSLTKGKPVKLELLVTLEDLYKGCTKQARSTRKIMNPDNRTTTIKEYCLKVDIKPGCPSDHEFPFPNYGDEGVGIIPGDVMVVLKVKPHARFLREGSNLVYNTDVFLVSALTGFILNITTLDDRVLHFPITEIIRPGSKKVVNGEGMPFENSRGVMGDLVIFFRVVFPKSLSPKQKDMIKQALPLPAIRQRPACKIYTKESFHEPLT